MARSWNPLQDLIVLQDRMNRLFEDATQRRVQAESEINDQLDTADWYPPADIVESQDEFIIAVDLPGVDRSALEISLDEDRLVIKGTRTIEALAQQRSERPHGRFIRSFGIPKSVEEAKIGAEYKDGVLKVILPKKKEQKAKRVEIRVS
jgi:HSP20 family protein